MEQVTLICQLVISLCSLAPTLVSLFMLVKNIIETKNWTTVVNMIQTAMSSVEAYSIAHPGMASEDKLNMALEAIKQSCEVGGITVDDALVKKIIAYIDEMCQWAKTVNTCQSGENK